MQIPETEEIGETGWFHSDHVETMTEAMERAKKVMSSLKQMAIEKKDKTLFLVSHGAFLAALFCLITQQ